MKDKDKTKDELINELQEMQKKYDSLKELYDKVISECRKADTELLKSEQRLKDITKTDWVWEVDKNGVYVYTSQTGIDYFGSSPEDIIGKTPFDFMPPDEAKRVAAIFSEIVANKAPIKDLENWNIKKNGELCCILSNGIPVLDEEGNLKGYRGVDKDITERKKAETEIQLKNELLRTINAEKDKFFSIIAHDLRGPLGAFLSATQILTEELQTMTLEEIKEITISMKESAVNVYGLLENLLEWSRLKRGMMDFNPEKINIKQKINSCIEVLKESARKKEISIQYFLPDDLEIYADLHMFETVIRNLVSNAIKFTPVGGKVSIAACRINDRSIEVKVSDSGIGMTTELKNKLFLLNEKTNRKGTEGELSTGLGLLLCKEFIDKHSGKIRVKSEVGKGSTFYFTIPVNTEPEADNTAKL